MSVPNIPATPIENPNAKWDLRFLEMAKLASTWSKDPSTKVGAVITEGKYIVSMGYNGLPRNYPSGGNEDTILGIREQKYESIIHAEINAVIHVYRRLDGCTLYTWPFPPCSRCAAIIIESGVKRVVAPIDKIDDRWKENIILSSKMFREAGVETVGLIS